MNQWDFRVVFRSLWGFLLVGLISGGCATQSAHFAALPEADADNQDILRVGDSLNVSFSDISPAIAPVETKISAEGKITLIHNQTFEADGKSGAELGQEIHDRLVPRFYRNLTVNIKNVGQFFYVDGEVKGPSRQPWIVPLTVTQAIASCGGFTEFARKTNVELIRVNGRKHTVDCKKCLTTPRLDLKVYPGDKVYVHRKPI